MPQNKPSTNDEFDLKSTIHRLFCASIQNILQAASSVTTKCDEGQETRWRITALFCLNNNNSTSVVAGMRKINRTTLVRLTAYGILTLCILGGALTYASSVMADQRVANLPASSSTSSHPNLKNLKVAYSSVDKSTDQYRDGFSNTKVESTASNSKTNVLLPVLTWFLGSAVLAMFGYKRMRHSES